MRQLVTVNARKYNGRIHRSWSVELIRIDNRLAEFYGIFDETIYHPNLGYIEAGTGSFEYYWFDDWFNIFRFHHPDGSLRNYYCNVNLPPEFSNGVLDYIDLDLDILVNPDLTYQILDQEEFKQNCELLEYPHEIRVRAQTTIEKLSDMIESQSFPFDYKKG